MANEITIDLDLLTWALERVGGEVDCRFEPVHSGDPDHHGREFAEALFDALKSEIAEMAQLRASALRPARTPPRTFGTYADVPLNCCGSIEGHRPDCVTLR